MIKPLATLLHKLSPLYVFDNFLTVACKNLSPQWPQTNFIWYIFPVDGDLRVKLTSAILFSYTFLFVCLVLYVQSTIFQLCRDGSSWVEPVLS